MNTGHFAIGLGLGLGLLVWATPAFATKPLEGLWGGKLGEIAIVAKGDQVEGTLVKTSELCPFKSGDLVLKGSFDAAENTLMGEMLLCQGVDECGPPLWVKVLVALDPEKGRMGGIGPRNSQSCPLVGYSQSGNGSQAIILKRLNANVNSEALNTLRADVAPAPKEKSGPADKKKPEKKRTVRREAVRALLLPGPPAAPGTYDPRAALNPPTRLIALLSDGRNALHTGSYEVARKFFEEALALDPGNPNALVGVGVSCAMRQQDEEAMRYYKAALVEDPNYGMAFYNIACLYARAKKLDMALRFLKVALENGFEVWATVEQDTDLATLRETPEYLDLARSFKPAGTQPTQSAPPAPKGSSTP